MIIKHQAILICILSFKRYSILTVIDKLEEMKIIKTFF